MTAGSVASAKRVLILGIYLADRENTAAHVVSEMEQSSSWHVDQRWVALGHTKASGRLAEVTVDQTSAFVPKFVLLNQMLATVAVDDYAFVLVCDDDITLPDTFLDAYLDAVCRYDFAVAQPARTHDSYIDHRFVEQLDGLVARRTRFVEIGPLFSIRSDAAPVLFPFDVSSPMGWGYDQVWPHVTESAGLRMGIVDATPVAHAFRKPVANYDYDTADRQMREFLNHRPHLLQHEAFFIIESYA